MRNPTPITWSPWRVLEIPQRPLEQMRVVAKSSKSGVAAVAQQSANNASRVAVIHTKTPEYRSPIASHRDSILCPVTDRAQAVLRGEHDVVGPGRHAVVTLESLLPELVSPLVVDSLPSIPGSRLSIVPDKLFRSVRTPAGFSASATAQHARERMHVPCQSSLNGDVLRAMLRN